MQPSVFGYANVPGSNPQLSQIQPLCVHVYAHVCIHVCVHVRGREN